MSIDKQTVQKVAKLARIDLDPAREEVIANELSSIFKWVEQLSEINTDQVEPMISVVENQSIPLRKDEIYLMNEKEAVLVNAPQSMQDFYTVPKVVE